MPPGQPQALTDPTPGELAPAGAAALREHHQAPRRASSRCPAPVPARPAGARAVRRRPDRRSRAGRRRRRGRDPVHADGTFLPCETVSVVGRDQPRHPGRSGPARPRRPTASPRIPPDTFVSQEDLLGCLLRAAAGLLGHPAGQPRAAGHDEPRRHRRLRDHPELEHAQLHAGLARWSACSPRSRHRSAAQRQRRAAGRDRRAAERTTVTLTASDLETALGGPSVSYFAAVDRGVRRERQPLPLRPNETYANDALSGTVLPPQPFPCPGAADRAGAALQRDPGDRAGRPARRAQHHAATPRRSGCR